jgi:hypothetical protein
VVLNTHTRTHARKDVHAHTPIDEVETGGAGAIEDKTAIARSRGVHSKINHPRRISAYH